LPENGEETNLVGNEETEKSIADYVERDTSLERKHSQDAKTVVIQAPEDMNTAEIMGATTSNSEKMFTVIANSIGESLSNLAYCNNEHVSEKSQDDGSDPRLGKLSDDYDAGWVISAITRTV
jgi:hypothetical protein